MQYTEYEYDIHRMKDAEKQQTETIDLDRSEWLWDNDIDASDIDHLKQDETERTGWQSIMQAQWIRYVGIAAAILLFSRLFAEQGISNFWWLFFIPMFIQRSQRHGQNMHISGLTKFALILFLFNMLIGGSLGIWFILIPLFWWGGRQNRPHRA